jgi:hypothetical protein
VEDSRRQDEANSVAQGGKCALRTVVVPLAEGAAEAPGFAAASLGLVPSPLATSFARSTASSCATAWVSVDESACMGV